MSGPVTQYHDELRRRCAGGLAGYMAWLYAETDFPACCRADSGAGRSTSALLRALTDCSRNGDDDDSVLWSSQAVRIMEIYQAVGDYEETVWLLDCLGSGGIIEEVV